MLEVENYEDIFGHMDGLGSPEDAIYGKLQAFNNHGQHEPRYKAISNARTLV